MSIWSKLGAWALAPVTGGLSVAGERAADQAGEKAAAAPAAWASRPDPYAGMPTAPADVAGGVTRDSRGLDLFKNEAFRTGPSMWAKLSQEQQAKNAQAARENGTAEVGSQIAQANDNLAMTGGLTSGARERLAASGGRNQLDMSQQVGKQESDNNMQIGINDEQNRIAQLGQVPGMDLSAAGFDLSKAQGQNQFNANNYQTQGGIWAAGKQADAEDPRNPSSPHFDDGKRWYNPFSW